MYRQELRSPGTDSHVRRGRFSMMARYSASACRSCSLKPAESARLLSRSALPQMRPTVRAASVASTASTDSPPEALVALHVKTVAQATITTAITDARSRRNAGEATRSTGDAREPSSAVATSQGDWANLGSIRSQEWASGVEGTSFRSERPFPASPRSATSCPLCGGGQQGLSFADVAACADSAVEGERLVELLVGFLPTSRGEERFCCL